jgi:hypothetical protein
MAAGSSEQTPDTRRRFAGVAREGRVGLLPKTPPQGIGEAEEDKNELNTSEVRKSAQPVYLMISW